jgi:hypothetical protein
MTLSSQKILALSLLCVLFSTVSFGEQRRYRGNGPKEWRVLFQLGADMGFPNSSADSMPGVTHGRKFTNIFLGNVGLGVKLFNFLYLGGRYQHWMATQDYTVSGTNIINELKYQALGAELGWASGNPRVFWILSGTYYYPLKSEVQQRPGNGIFQSPTKRGTYEGRATLGVRFSSRFTLLFTGGYRYANFGKLSSGAGTALLPASADLDLSCIFGGLGLGITF